MAHSSSRALAVHFLCTLLLGGCRREAGRDPAAATEHPVPVTVQVVSLEDVPELRRLSADVMPWDVLPLSFKVGGRVMRLLVEEGDRVQAGQLVALLDSKDYKLVRDLAQTQVQALEPHLQRAAKLRGEAALPQAKLDELQSKMDAARIQHQQARAQLSYAALRAPMAGVVLMRRVAVGDLVDPSRPVAVIADLRRVKVVLPVAQRDLHLFRKGMTLELVAAGVPQTFTGTVHHLPYAADPKTRTFPVTVEVRNDELALRAGMIVEARVLVARHRGFFVPLDAVSRDLGGRTRVLVVERDRAAEHAITLGPVFGERVLVSAGLRPDERVIVQGLPAVGDLVLVVQPGTPLSVVGRGSAAGIPERAAPLPARPATVR